MRAYRARIGGGLPPCSLGENGHDDGAMGFHM